MRAVARAVTIVLPVVLIAVLSSSTGRSDEQTTDILWTQQKQHSLGNEELIIRDFFQDKRDGFFVDIGCAWPIKNSNTYYLEKNLGWTGIGVDALADYAAGWAKSRPKSKFLNFLVTDESDKPKKFYKVAVGGMSTAEKDVADHLKVVDELQVPGTTLDDLLQRNGVKEIDLLSIDVEGHQKSVLAGFDLQRWKPKLVCIEDDGTFSVPWFKERGYEPIGRYRLRDIANWYFAPKELAQAANARETEHGREEARKREAMMASAPEDSPLRAYAPQYVLAPDGLPVPNPVWRKVKTNPEAAEAQAEPAAPSPRVSDGPTAPR